MGGCSSKFAAQEQRRRSTIYGRRNTLIIRPKVNINVGACINKETWHSHKGRKIIFIFGGPGSGKGIVVDNLINMYGIHLLCCEDMLYNDLLHQVTNNAEIEDDQKFNDNMTKDIQRFILQDPSKFNREWLFDLLDKEVEKYAEGDVILVDLVPNLKFLLRCSCFTEKDPSNSDLEKFETKFPIQFAIDLTLEKKDLANNISQTHACTKNIQSKTADKGGSSQSDEIDMSRTERRFNVYISSVEEFVNYFKNNGKLLAIDTSSCDIEAVWLAIRDYIVETEMVEPKNGIEQVILFQMGENDFSDIDLTRYPMEPLVCKELRDDHKTCSPSLLLADLGTEMRKRAVSAKSFLFNCTETLMDKKEALESLSSNNSLVFMEEEVGTLDFYLHGLRRRSQRKKSIARKNAQLFKTITTGDKEALIFPLETDSELCRLICMAFINHK